MEDKKVKVKEPKQEAKKEPQKLLARKAFVINQNGYRRVIFQGEDISDVPEKYHANLKTENVI